MLADTQLSIEELEKELNILRVENKVLKERELSILRALPEIVFMIDVNERFVFLNNTCLEKFKLTNNDLEKSLYLKDLITPESLFHLRKLYIQKSDKNVINAPEIIGIRKDGNKFSFTAYFTKLIENNKIKGFIGIGIDLTERIAIEAQLKEANLAKMKFFSIIAHDLRNSFNSLVGFSNLLLTNYNNYSGDKIKEYINYMSKSATNGFQLLENLLDWARANMRKIEINLTTFNLERVIIETVNLLSGVASKKGIRIELDVPDHIFVFADQNMIRTVIRNLISNAIKFTERGGLIKLVSKEESGFALVEVIDNGVGISPDKLPHLFSLSNDYSTLGTEKETGTGLGLILCYEFISLNKGNIEAESTFRKGSIFRFRIPLLDSSIPA